MIVTSESTALSVIRMEARTGTLTRRKLLAAREGGSTLLPAIRPSTMNTNTGTTIIPTAPSGSRRKTLISIHVSVQSPRSIGLLLVANRVAGEFEEDIFEVGENRPEVRDFDLVFRKAANHLGHEVISGTANREAEILARDGLKSWNRSKTFLGGWVVRREHHGSLRAVPLDQRLRCADVDDPAMLDDGHAVAQALGFFHEMRGQANRLATLADAADQLPDRPPILRIQAGG